VPTPALSDDPNIILVHIGTNDMAQNTADANGALDDLLDDLIAGAPDALIVVSSIIPLPSANAKVMSFNQHVVEAVAARADSAHIIYLDQFADFPTGELGDGVHPNETGYARMGKKWFDAIEPYLK
jgi:lysophospholipase L1-like esterase